MSIKTIAIALKKLLKASSYLLYPPLCVHCQSGMSTPLLLCDNCTSELRLMELDERCPRCFSVDYCPERAFCADCLKESPLLTGMAAAFDYTGPAGSLVRQLKYGGASYLSTGCGAYLAAQFLRLDWPLPDLIVPVPIAFSHWLGRGYNQSHLLAMELGKLLNRPTAEVLIRTSGDYSQAALSLQQRRQLTGNCFRLKPGCHQQLREKQILLIDDVLTTGSTFRRCAEVLAEACPANVYGLVFCRTL